MLATKGRCTKYFSFLSCCSFYYLRISLLIIFCWPYFNSQLCAQAVNDYERPLILQSSNFLNEQVPQYLIEVEEAFYLEKDYEKVVQLIEENFGNISRRYEKIAAYRFLTLSFQKLATLNLHLPAASKQYLQKARKTVRGLLIEFPNYNYEFWEENDDAYIRLIESKRKELDFVITPHRQWDSPLRAPANVITISGEEMIDRGYANILDLLAELPGFDVINHYSESYGVIMPRGFRSETSSRISLMVDGEIQNQAFSGASYISHQYPIQTIDRIEIQYGPGNFSYGPGPSLSIVNIITKTPKASLGYTGDLSRVVNGQIMVSQGSYGTTEAEAYVSGRLKNVFYSVVNRFYWSREFDLSSVDSTFNFSSDRYNDLDYNSALATDDPEAVNRILSFPNWPSFYNMQGAGLVPTTQAIETARGLDMAAFDAGRNGENYTFSNFSRNWFFDARVQYKNFSFGFNSFLLKEGYPTTLFHRFKNEPGIRHNQAGAGNGNNQIIFNQGISVVYDEKTSRSTALKLRLFNKNQSVALRDWHIQSYGDGFLNGEDLLSGVLPGLGRENRKQRSLVFGIDGHWMHRIKSWWRYSLDANYRLAIMERNYLQFIDLGINSWVLGLGVNNQFIISPNFDVAVSFRYDFNDSFDSFSFGGFGGMISPKVAAIYHRNDWSLKGIYSRGFLEPFGWIKYHEFRPEGTDRTPEINFRQPTETVDHYELVGIYQNNNLYLNASLFYYTLEKAIILRNYPYEYSFEDYSEGDEFNAYGGQLLLKWSNTFSEPKFGFINKISLSGNFSYTFSEQTADDFNTVALRVGDIAENKFHANVGLQFSDYFNLSLRYSNIGPRFAGPGTTTFTNPSVFPGYELFSGAISYKRNRYTLQFVANNIFNEIYTHPGPYFADDQQFRSAVFQRDRNYTLRLFLNWQVKRPLANLLNE